MRWTIRGERSLYESEWVRLHLADVELPNGERFEHHLIRAPMPASGVVVRDVARGVLMLWRHRFITDSWGWEIPAGRVEPGESVQAAARREVLEETGWQPGPLETLVAYHPSNGLSDQTFHLFLADSATEVGPPIDVHEAERISWVPVSRLTEAVRAGEVRDGLSLTALCWCLAFGLLLSD